MHSSTSAFCVSIHDGGGHTPAWAAYDVWRRRGRLGLLNDSVWSCDRRCLPSCHGGGLACWSTGPCHGSRRTRAERGSTALFIMLATMTKGPALAIVRQAEISGGGPNGLEAWRLLVRRFEPEAATRTLGLLQQILNPAPFPENVTGFEEALSK